MGFQRSQLKLKFEDPDMEALEAVCKRLSISDVMALTKMQESPDGTNGIEMISLLADVLGSVLKSWNVEDENGLPVPATREGLLSMDPAFLTQVAKACIDASVGVSLPLNQPSEGGDPSQELQIPMETL